MINLLVKERPNVGNGWSVDSNVGYQTGAFPSIFEAAEVAVAYGRGMDGSGQPGFVVFLDYNNATSSAGWIVLYQHVYPAAQE